MSTVSSQPTTGSNTAVPATSVRRRTWAAYTAAWLAGIFAAISVYWALGGMIGINTVGGDIAAMAKSGTVTAFLMAWGAAVMKAAGVVFALALVQRWGRVFPRWLMLGAGWLAAVVLTAYGVINVALEFVVTVGIMAVPNGADLYALHWHLWLWDPLFAVWGILLAIALVHYRTNPQR